MKIVTISIALMLIFGATACGTQPNAEVAPEISAPISPSELATPPPTIPEATTSDVIVADTIQPPTTTTTIAEWKAPSHIIEGRYEVAEYCFDVGVARRTRYKTMAEQAIDCARDYCLADGICGNMDWDLYFTKLDICIAYEMFIEEGIILDGYSGLKTLPVENLLDMEESCTPDTFSFLIQFRH